MKKIILILASTLFLTGCFEPGAKNPGGGNEKVYVKVGSKVLQAHWVILTEGGNGIYILTPKDTTVEVITETIGFTSGKTQTSVITVE